MKTLVLGGSLNPQRYSFKAIKMLLNHQIETVSIGLRAGNIDSVMIETEKKYFQDIDTITLYLNPKRQIEYYDYIISIKPRRIIFNPGTENSEFETIANREGIQTINACTLVMLSTGQY
jgi:predicted CoA-binding protein